jgi:hypothetical protein
MLVDGVGNKYGNVLAGCQSGWNYRKYEEGGVVCAFTVLESGALRAGGTQNGISTGQTI